MSKRATRPRYQVTLSVMPGSEPWIRVEHSWGWFKVPAGVAASEILEGISERWVDGHAGRAGELYVRVPLREWRELERRRPPGGGGGGPVTR